MESKLEQFASLFKGIKFDIKIKDSIEELIDAPEEKEEHVQQPETREKAKVELNRALQKAKADLANARKLFKQGKISNDDLLENEWRVYELKEQIDRMYDDDYLDELDDETR